MEGGDRNGSKRKLNRMVVVIPCQMKREKKHIYIYIHDRMKVLDNGAANLLLLSPSHIISVFIGGVVAQW